MAKVFSPVMKIAKFTCIDDMRQKSFIVMFIVCAVFVFLFRGCYHGNYMVNGQVVDTGIVIRTVSKMIFHAIAAGVMLLTALFSMRAFKRDRDYGTQSFILSKPIARWQYVVGKITGLWVLSAVYMFILHSIVFVITSISLKAFLPEYLFGSLLCSFNLLFVVIGVLFLSLLMPDIVAFLCVMCVGVVSFMAEGIYAVSHSQIAQMMMQQSDLKPDVAWWQVVYCLWPKLSGVQQFASSYTAGGGLHGFGSIYPFINVLFYCLVIGIALLRRFKNTDIV